MSDKSTSLSATKTSAGQESTRNHEVQEQDRREQEHQQEWQDNNRPPLTSWEASAEAFLRQSWPAPLRPSSVFVLSCRSSTVPSLSQLLLDHEDDETASCWHRARHELEEPGSRRDFLLDVIDSALQILDMNDEDTEDNHYKHHESNNALLPQ